MELGDVTACLEADLCRQGGKLFLRQPSGGLPGLQCVFIFFDPESKVLAGILCLHVDDLLLGGCSTAYRQTVNALRSRFPFRRWKSIEGEFGGSIVSQDVLTKEITVSQSTHALKINKVTVRARAQPEDKATTAEVRSLRERNGAVQWPAKESRPDLAVHVSFSQQAFSDPRARHCRQASAMVRRARQHHELMWRFLPVPLKNSLLVMHTDAAFQNAQVGASQAGYIIAVTDDRLARGELAPWSPLIWRSHKMRRVVGITLAAETQSLLGGLGRAGWIAAHFAEARFPNFDVAQRSIFLRHFQIQRIVDAKSLYDHLISLSSPSSVEDKRCGFDLVISWQCMQRLGATIRWASTNRQLADALTKDAADPVDLLRSCMRSGEYQLAPEHIILERAAAERTRRKQRQAFSQSSSLQSEPSV